MEAESVISCDKPQGIRGLVSHTELNIQSYCEEKRTLVAGDVSESTSLPVKILWGRRGPSRNALK